jgi:DNA-binding transcriptional regulator YiaG
MTPKEIKQIRTALQRTQVSMAKIIGTSAITVSRWERGESHPLPVYLEKLTRLRDYITRKAEEGRSK